MLYNFIASNFEQENFGKICCNLTLTKYINVFPSFILTHVKRRKEIIMISCGARIVEVLLLVL